MAAQLYWELTFEGKRDTAGVHKSQAPGRPVNKILYCDTEYAACFMSPFWPLEFWMFGKFVDRRSSDQIACFLGSSLILHVAAGGTARSLLG